ncbi:MAG: hypothetical protein ACSHYF_05785 [Verrucomicrobiaceae bacterium]
MNFARPQKSNSTPSTLPPELIGFWKIPGNPFRYEIRDNDRYYVHNIDIPYQLLDGGMTFVHKGTRYNRVFGDPADLPGVWHLEDDPSEEWNLRADGTHTYHWPGFVYSGEYTFDAHTISDSSIRALLSENAGILTFDPPYEPTVTAPWSLTEPTLTIDFPSGTTTYNRD